MTKRTIRRTTHRSASGKRLYAKRRKGKFTDIQTYKRAHGQDIKRSSKAERTKRARKR